MSFWSELDWSGWAYGLMAGSIGGGATAVYGALAVAMIDSRDFSVGSAKSFKLMGLMFAMSFIKDAALYLKQNPLPTVKVVKRVETVAHQENPATTVTTTIEQTTTAKVIEEGKK